MIYNWWYVIDDNWLSHLNIVSRLPETLIFQRDCVEIHEDSFVCPAIWFPVFSAEYEVNTFHETSLNDSNATWCHYYYRYSALGPVWAETRAQSVDWYSSGTLHPGQVLRGSLPLLFPAFRRSHFRHQVPPRPPRCERSPAAEVGTVGENVVR